MRICTRGLLVLPAIALASLLPPFSGGVSPPGGARSLPACGLCHRSEPGVPAGQTKQQITLAPSVRSMSTGQAISITTSVTGGQPASALGGFYSDVVGGGSFAAAGNTRVWAGGAAIGHSDKSTRSWTYGYTAPSTPGLVEMYVVVNTVDNSGLNDAGDWWAFHNHDANVGTSTPVRLFANTAGVTERGPGCAGSFGNWPVLGTKQTPAAGNAAFALEVHGAAPSTGVGLAIGADNTFPGLDLTLIGVNGCTLHVNALAVVPGATGPGNALRGDGMAVLPLPIPNDPTLPGGMLQLQVAILDPANGRPIPITMTNALDLVIQ